MKGCARSHRQSRGLRESSTAILENIREFGIIGRCQNWLWLRNGQVDEAAAGRDHSRTGGA